VFLKYHTPIVIAVTHFPGLLTSFLPQVGRILTITLDPIIYWTYYSSLSSLSCYFYLNDTQVIGGTPAHDHHHAVNTGNFAVLGAPMLVHPLLNFLTSLLGLFQHHWPVVRLICCTESNFHIEIKNFRAYSITRSSSQGSIAQFRPLLPYAPNCLQQPR
jgi:hypothetical protein